MTEKKISRREVLKLTGVLGASVLLGEVGLTLRKLLLGTEVATSLSEAALKAVDNPILDIDHQANLVEFITIPHSPDTHISFIPIPSQPDTYEVYFAGGQEGYRCIWASFLQCGKRWQSSFNGCQRSATS